MKQEYIKTYGQLAGDIQEIAITEEALRQRVTELGAEISRDYAGKTLLLIGVLKGVMCFVADLVRAITIPVQVDYMVIAGYSARQPFKGVVRLEKDVDLQVEGQHVLFVEDVVDTGLTLNYMLRTLRTRNPASLEVCTLFNKPERRLIETPIRYQGFNLPDYFVVGYGLDHHELYRNLPFVGVLKPEALFGEDES